VDIIWRLRWRGAIVMNLDASRNRPTGTEAVTTFTSRDIDFVSERITSLTGASTKADDLDDPRAFSLSLATAKLGCLLLSKGWGTSWSLTRSMGRLADIAVPIMGSPMKIRRGTHSYEVSARGHAAVWRPFEQIEESIHEGSAMSLHAPIEALIAHAEQLTGESLSSSAVSTMADRVSLSSPVGEAFARTLKTAFVEFCGLDSAGLGRLAIAGYEDMLINLAAAALFPAVSDRLGRPAAQCAPAAIRRARDLIKAHAAEPFRISKLAADLGLPMRTLQDNFRRLFGLSPREWLLECRLENARQRLTLPDRAASVSLVAYVCGFGDLSGFSAKYRKRYGEAPSQTLRVAHRHFSTGRARSIAAPDRRTFRIVAVNSFCPMMN
jgi:AraC-like DNA-binding protein